MQLNPILLYEILYVGVYPKAIWAKARREINRTALQAYRVCRFKVQINT